MGKLIIHPNFWQKQVKAKIPQSAVGQKELLHVWEGMWYRTDLKRSLKGQTKGQVSLLLPQLSATPSKLQQVKAAPPLLKPVHILPQMATSVKSNVSCKHRLSNLPQEDFPGQSPPDGTVLTPVVAAPVSPPLPYVQPTYNVSTEFLLWYTNNFPLFQYFSICFLYHLYKGCRRGKVCIFFFWTSLEKSN